MTHRLAPWAAAAAALAYAIVQIGWLTGPHPRWAFGDSELTLPRGAVIAACLAAAAVTLTLLTTPNAPRPLPTPKVPQPLAAPPVPQPPAAPNVSQPLTTPNVPRPLTAPQPLAAPNAPRPLTVPRPLAAPKVPRRLGAALVVAAWALSVVLAASAAMVLLDLVGRILPGLGIPHDGPGFASRLGCLAVAALTATTALTRQRVLRGCHRCSRIPRLDHTPRWAYLAAYTAVAGFAIRILAQITLFGPIPYKQGPQLLVFDAGFLLGGVLLPLALVHSWGKTWPRWVLPLAGRRVPRWLVIGPGFGIAAALLAYFGVALAQLAQESLAGTLREPLFMWTAISAYTLWGIGLAIASTAYYRVTKPICLACRT